MYPANYNICRANIDRVRFAMAKNGVDQLDFDELMKIQSIMNKSVKKEIEDEILIDIISLVNQLISNTKPTMKENILIEAKNKGFTSKQMTTVINKMIRDKIVFEPKEGYLQRY